MRLVKVCGEGPAVCGVRRPSMRSPPMLGLARRGIAVRPQDDGFFGVDGHRRPRLHGGIRAPEMKLAGAEPLLLDGVQSHLKRDVVAGLGCLGRPTQIPTTMIEPELSAGSTSSSSTMVLPGAEAEAEDGRRRTGPKCDQTRFDAPVR
jgi:hypothetical protein